MPEITTEWQRFETLMAGELYELLRFRHCERFPLQPIVLSAQLLLVPFYQSFGFAPTSEPYDDFGVAHVEMVLRPR